MTCTFVFISQTASLTSLYSTLFGSIRMWIVCPFHSIYCTFLWGGSRSLHEPRMYRRSARYCWPLKAQFSPRVSPYLMFEIAFAPDCIYILEVRGSVHHNTIHNKSNKMQQRIKLLLVHIYIKLNMFRATPPIIRSLKLHWQPLIYHT